MQRLREAAVCKKFWELAPQRCATHQDHSRIKKCLLTRASPLASGLGPRAYWHCLKRSWWAALCIAALMSYPCFRQPVLLITAGTPECFVGAWESSGAPSVPVLCSVGNMDNHGCMQSFYLLEGMPVHTLTYPLWNALAFAGLKGNCARTNLLPPLSQMMNSYTVTCKKNAWKEKQSYLLFLSLPTAFVWESSYIISSFIFVITFQFQLTISWPSHSYSTFPPGRRY